MEIGINDGRGELGKELSPTEELLKMVRAVRTIGDQAPIYAEAEIALKQFDPKELHPTALYLLEGNMKFVQRMHEDLLKVGINDFKLDKVVKWGPYTVAPPVVEWIDGVWAIVDGGHRVKNAEILNESLINVVTIKGARVDKPFISYPVNWSEVMMCQVKPDEESALRKLRSGLVGQRDKMTNLFRDLSELAGQPARRKLAWQTA